MRIQPPGVSSEKSSQHVYSLAENSPYGAQFLSYAYLCVTGQNEIQGKIF